MLAGQVRPGTRWYGARERSGLLLTDNTDALEQFCDGLEKQARQRHGRARLLGPVQQPNGVAAASVRERRGSLVTQVQPAALVGRGVGDAGAS